MNISDRRHKVLFSIFLVAFAFKQLMTRHIPIYIIASGGLCDDQLMVRLAQSLLHLDWLGPYDWLTHVKGAGFPFFLAVANVLGLDYITASNMLYAAACTAFALAFRPVIRRSWPLAVLYLILLFNPITHSFQIQQRVYRNGISISFSLLFFAGMIGLYLRSHKQPRAQLPWAAAAALALTWVWHTREDGMWLLPFLVVATVVMLSRHLWKRASRSFVKALICVLPAGMLWLSIVVVSLINYQVYGVYLTTDVSGDTAFGRAMSSLYAVRPDDSVDQSNTRGAIYRDTIERLYQHSPTLLSIRPQIEEALDSWDVSDTTPGDGEVESGWFFWCLREAVSKAGLYSTPQTAEAFYQAIHAELEQAFDSGALHRRPTMPSALMPPFPDGGVGALASGVLDCFLYVANAWGTEADVVANFNPPDEARLFEVITLNHSHTEALYNGMSVPFAEVSARVCNIVSTIYQRVGFPVSLLGLAAYVLVAAAAFLRKRGAFEVWLSLTGILASLLILFIGVSYNHLTSCYSIHSLYLACAYPLLSAFSVFSIYFASAFFLANRHSAD